MNVNTTTTTPLDAAPYPPPAEAVPTRAEGASSSVVRMRQALVALHGLLDGLHCVGAQRATVNGKPACVQIFHLVRPGEALRMPESVNEELGPLLRGMVAFAEHHSGVLSSALADAAKAPPAAAQLESQQHLLEAHRRALDESRGESQKLRQALEALVTALGGPVDSPALGRTLCAARQVLAQPEPGRELAEDKAFLRQQAQESTESMRREFAARMKSERHLHEVLLSLQETLAGTPESLEDGPVHLRIRRLL